MTATTISRTTWLKKGEIFILFFLLEALVFAILPLSARQEWLSSLLVIHAAVTAAFLVAAWFLRRSENGRALGQVCSALFAGGAAILVSTLFSGDLIRPFGFAPNDPPGIAMVKLAEAFLRVTVALGLMALAGADRRAMFLQKGKLGLGLAAGGAGFLVMAAIAFLPMVRQAGAPGRLVALLPWILIFVFANGFAEELVFRGLLLKRYEPFLGKGLANLLAAIVFTLVHMQVGYVPDVAQFLLVVFPLALLWGYLMQKTEGLWGSALFHAGADSVIIFGIFTSFS